MFKAGFTVVVLTFRVLAAAENVEIPETLKLSKFVWPSTSIS